MINQVALGCDTLGPCAVVRVAGIEAMNALSRWTADVLCVEGSIDTEGLIGQPALLGLADDEDGVRSIPLVITGASYGGPYRDGFRFGLDLAPRAAQLLLRSGHRVFQDMTAQEIVARILTDAGIPATEIAWRLAGQYAKRVYCVQYGESEWAFITRLLADEGINHWFDHKANDKPLLVFGDGMGSHESIAGEMTIRYEDASGLARSSAALYELSRTFELAHDSVHVRDYDVRHPDVLIEGKAGTGPLEYYEFPARVPGAEAAAARAKTRLEQLQRWMVCAEGQSGCARLQPGRVMRIAGASDEVINGDHLIVRVEHSITQASRNESAAARPYTNRVLLAPFGKERYHRPDLPGAVPKVDGLETATVTGLGGEEIHVDDIGCIKVRFPWDRSGIGDDKDPVQNNFSVSNTV